MKMALEGLKVVEVGNILAGPWCGHHAGGFSARRSSSRTAEKPVI
jgi:crotonobetainyl-CoA:carnitine CoA-transferase CaiB-like acyl-CoA transferase